MDKLTLTENMIRRLLPPELGGLDIQIYERLPSTNTLLCELAAGGAPDGSFILAGEQTAGRGRQGRSFFSPRGTGLYMSLLLRRALPRSDPGSLTTAAALALCRVLRRLTGEPVEIKWVNDLYLRGHKICGILVEGSFRPGGQELEWAVIGAGINLAPPAGGFPPELADKAGYLTDIADGTLAAAIAAGFITGLYALCPRLGSPELLAEYRTLSCVLGREITFPGPEGPRRALAEDIGEDFSLLIRLPDGRRESLSWGEVSILPL